MEDRRSTVLRLLATLALLSGLCGCAPGQSAATAKTPTTAISQHEMELAAAAAHLEILKEVATVSNASVTAELGTVSETNTGSVCRSGRLLLIRLIGTFPRVAVTGHPVESGSPDFTVRAMTLTADAASGSVCLIQAQTGENGPVTPLPSSASLPLP